MPLSTKLMLSQSQMSKFLPSPSLVNRVAPISVSLTCGPHSCACTLNATVGGRPSGSTVRCTPILFPKVLNAKQGNSMYRYSSLCYDSTGHRTPTYRVQSEHSTTGPRPRCLYARLIVLSEGDPKFGTYTKLFVLLNKNR